MPITDIFSFGNLKLPKTTAIFNLPRMLTCPGATPLCKQICYASKAERMHRVVRTHRHDMFMLSKTNAFPWILETALDRLPKTVTAVRIHESGDFYDQRYLDTWINAMKKFPQLTFYAYTKSSRLNFTRPDNFVIRLSMDSTSEPYVYDSINKFDGISWLQQKGEELPDWINVENPLVCPGDCKVCSYCLKKGGDLVIPEH